jgi:hypothetical protein
VDAVPYTSATLNTLFYGSDYGYSDGACPGEGTGWGAGAPDVAFSFTPTATGDYLITLDGAFDSNLYVVTDCAAVDTSCVQAEENSIGAPEVTTVALAAGTTYFIIADGWSNDDPSNGGEFTLSIEQVPCTVGDTICNAANNVATCQGDGFTWLETSVCTVACDDSTEPAVCVDTLPPAPGGTCGEAVAYDIPAVLPFTDVAATNCGFGNDYSSTCLGSYDGGEEIIYAFNVTADTSVAINLNTNGTTWVGIAIDSACPLNGTTCVNTATTSGSSPSMACQTLTAGTYYVMIDTYPSPDCIPDFDLSITACTP